MLQRDGRAKAKRIRVLVVAADPVIAALLGLLLDPGAYEPVFPGALESPEQALTRMRPRLVILLDADLDAARSDLFFARTERLKASVVIFEAPTVGSRTPPDRVSRGSGAVLHLPTDRETLSQVLDRAVADAMTSGLWTITAVMGVVALAMSVSPVASG